MRLMLVTHCSVLDGAYYGYAYDCGACDSPGARLGPRVVRAQSSLIRPYSYFQKVAPFDRLNVADIGDIDAPPVSIEKCYDVVSGRIVAISHAGARPIVIGADHSILLPILPTLANHHSPMLLA